VSGTHEGRDRESAGADDLSLQEAAELYEVPYKTLGLRVRYGEIEAYKARGPWGREWRVSREALEAFGYRPREVREPGAADQPDDLRAQRLEKELAAAKRAAAAERNRASAADQRLGEALLECGRLRAALRAVGASPERGQSPSRGDVTAAAQGQAVTDLREHGDAAMTGDA
jgi:excisionase family DNA binding protein